MSIVFAVGHNSKRMFLQVDLSVTFKAPACYSELKV